MKIALLCSVFMFGIIRLCSGQSVAAGTYPLINQASNLALVDVSYQVGVHQTIEQWPYDGGSDAQWQITPLGNGYYEIVNQASGWALVDAGYQVGIHHTIQQWPYDGGSDAQWQITPMGNGYYEIINQASGWALVDAGSQLQYGATIEQWPYDYQADAHWQIGVGGSSDGSGSTASGSDGGNFGPSHPSSLNVVTIGNIGIINECNAAGEVYGIGLDIKYQVLDQYGSAIHSAAMTPQEYGTANGSPYGVNNIGPRPGYPTSSQNTASDGTFHDVPLGICGTGPFVNAFNQQNIQISYQGTIYLVRQQSFFASSSLAYHGSITNNNDISVSY